MTFRALLVGAGLTLSLNACGDERPSRAETAPAVEPTTTVQSGLAATENFMTTWNTRDPTTWAGSLNYPHARPSAAGGRVWQTRDDYIATVDFERVIATGWDHTVFEDLRVIHEGDSTAHVAGRWGRVDAEGNTIRRNLVTYIATAVDGRWGIQARFGAGRPIPVDQQAPIAVVAVAKVEEFLTAFNARDRVALAAVLNYPHVRVTAGTVRAWNTAEEFVAGMDFDDFAEREDWDQTSWDEIEAVQVAENAVNIAFGFRRHNAAGDVTSTFNALYLVTSDDGRWGIRARSFFAR